MLAGEFGEPRRWAMAHQIAVGEFFDAADLVPVSQAHIMADTESLGEAGVRFLETLAAAPEAERRVRVPAITDPRGIDFAVYRRLGQTPAMAALEARLRERAGEDTAEIARRMGLAHEEISHSAEFDHVVVNDVFEHALAGLRAILHAARAATARQTGLAGFIAGLDAP